MTENDKLTIKELAKRLWRVHPREVQGLNITRQAFYEREILAVVLRYIDDAESLRAAIIRIDAINDSPACFNKEINDLCDPILRPHLSQQKPDKN